MVQRPSQEVQQRHRRLQTNPSGVPVMLRLFVAILAKGTTISFVLRLDAKHHRNADTDIINGLMY